MDKMEILKEYINFLQDTGKKDNRKSKEDFKKEYICWYVELFGIDDGRTKEIINELSEF